MKNCPRCSASLGDTALACSCGWKDRKEKTDYSADPIRIECAYMSCQQRSKVKVMTPTGWANFCAYHYDIHFLNQAEQICERLNLKTVDEKRAWASETARSASAKMRPDYLRQPGEDEEFTYIQA